MNDIYLLVMLLLLHMTLFPHLYSKINCNFLHDWLFASCQPKIFQSFIVNLLNHIQVNRIMLELKSITNIMHRIYYLYQNKLFRSFIHDKLHASQSLSFTLQSWSGANYGQATDNNESHFVDIFYICRFC